MQTEVNGTQVKLDGLHIGRTYAGMMEGLPTRETNLKTIDRLKKEAAKLFRHGQHQIFCPSPNVKPIDTSFFAASTKENYPFPEMLPEYYLIVCLDGPANSVSAPEPADGASALLLLFADNISSPLPQMIANLCKSLKWEDIAYDYEF